MLRRLAMKKRWFRRSVCLLLLGLWSVGVLGEVKKGKIHELNRDIVLLNLINGLYLTEEQTVSLIEKIKEAEEAREVFEKALEEKEKNFEDVLKDVRDVLLTGDEIPDDLKRRVREMKEVQHRSQDERGEKLINLESEVEGLLTKNQLVTIDSYKPCTIPPAQGKIGQSVETAAEGIARQLTRIRRLPNSRYELMKDMFVDFNMDKVEKHLGFLNPEEKEQYRQQTMDTFEKARNLSDKEFLLQKGELALELMPEDVKIRRRRINQLGRVGFFLLDPALIPILETRLKKGLYSI